MTELVEPTSTALGSDFARLGRASVVFAVGATAGKFVGLVLLPVLTRALTPSQYGSMDVLMALGTALTATLMLGLDVAALRLYFDQPDPRARRILLGTWCTLSLIVTTIAAIVIAGNSAAISAALFSTTVFQPAVVAIAVILMSQTIEIIVLTVLRAQGRAGWFATINGGVLVLYASLTIAFLALGEPNANVVLIALAIALTTFALLGVYLVRHEIAGMPTIRTARALLWLGLPLAPAVAGSLAADFVNRTILLGAAGAAEVAHFTVATRFASVAGLAVAGFQLAWQPRAYAFGTSQAARGQLASEARWITATVCVVVVLLGIASPEVLELVAGHQYAAALPTLGVCLVTVLGTALYLVASLPSSIARATQDLGLATGGAVAVSIAGSLLFAPVWHSLGTATAVAVGQLVAVAIVAALGRRRLPIPFDWAGMGSLVALTGLVVLALLFGNANLVMRLIGGLLALAFIVVLTPIRQTVATAWRSRTPVGDSNPCDQAFGHPKQGGDATAAEASPQRETLVVRIPDTYVQERRYVLDTILGEWLGFEYELARGEASRMTIRLAGDSDGRELALPDVLFATESNDWLSERSMPARPLSCLTPLAPSCPEGTGTVPGRSPAGPIPVLFGTPAHDGRAWQDTPTGVALTIDVFGGVFFMITRYEEVVGTARDPHERFPAAASLAVMEGFIDRPLADEYVNILWMAMRSLWPALRRRQSRFRLMLTHDVDQAWAAYGRPPRVVAHAIAGDFARRRDPGLAARRSRAFLDARAGRVDRDPFNTFDFLMDASERHGLRSTFYFMAGGTSDDMDGGYRLTDPPTARLLRRINDRGHEIGLHLSYNSYTSAVQTRMEFETLRAACRAVGFDQPAWRVRQHFLRFRNPLTWQIQDSSGLDCDSSLGFPERVGFRAGTCREYQVFDLIGRRKLALRERPLVAMDGTLVDYMGLDPAEAAAREIAIVDVCRRFGGNAVVCHHNMTLVGKRQRAYYRDLVDELALLSH